MKLHEQVLDSYISKMVNVNEMQLGFVPSGGTTGSTFVGRQLQEKYIAAKKNTLLCRSLPSERSCFKEGPVVGHKGAMGLRNGLCVSFKACTPMPRVVCRSIVSAIMSLAWEFMCIRTLPLAHCSSSRCWRRFHMSSAFECRGSFSSFDDLLLITNTQAECISKLNAWKAGMESKELHVNMKKTK